MTVLSARSPFNLTNIKTPLAALVERQTGKDTYEFEEFSRAASRSPSASGRIRAEKKSSGRGAHIRWVVSHDELLRYRRQGLLSLNSAG